MTLILKFVKKYTYLPAKITRRKKCFSSNFLKLLLPYRYQLPSQKTNSATFEQNSEIFRYLATVGRRPNPAIRERYRLHAAPKMMVIETNGLDLKRFTQKKTKKRKPTVEVTIEDD